MTSRKQWDETPCVGSRGPTQQMPLLADGSWTSVINRVSWNKGWKWFLLVNVRQNVSDRQISRRICWKRQDLCFDWNFRGHLGQLCGFIDEHAEALEVCDHWGIWPFGGGVEAHPSPSQLQDRIPLVLWNLGSCSPSATGSSEEWRYEGAPLRAPQMKSPKMPYSGLTCTLTQWHSHWLCDTRWHLVLSAKFTWVVLGSYDSSVCTVSKEYSSCEGLS